MAKRQRQNDSLKRRKPYRRPIPRFLVVCEGVNTEPSYFKSLRNDFRGSVHVEPIGKGFAPISLLKEAIKLRREAEEEANRLDDPNSRFDETWIVFDVDDDWENRRINDVLQTAEAQSIGVAISNPCFELWGVLHFEPYDRSGSRHDVQNRLADLVPKYRDKKTIPYEVLTDRYLQAVDCANSQLGRREADGALNGNPSTTVQYLTEQIRDKSKRD